MDDVTICNMALGEAGARTTITSLSEKSKEANLCAIYYTPARDAVLQAARWNFARKQLNLALLKDATATPPQAVPVPWLYEYAFPSDCIQGRYIMPMFDSLPGTVAGLPAASVYRGPPVKFVVSNDLDTSGADIRVILTNQPQAVFVYTKQTQDPNQFDAQFVECLAATLAAKLIKPLTGKSPTAQMEIAKGLIISAAASNGNEGMMVQEHTPDWMRVRGYMSDWQFPEFFMTDGSVGQFNTIG
jgi:hypothetical protein